MNKCLLCVLLLETTLAAQPLELESRLEMMVDSPLVDEMTGVSLELQKPSRAGHALEFNDLGDRDASGIANVIEDESLHRLYSRSGPADETAGKYEGSAPFVSAATSRDLTSFPPSDRRIAPPLI